jgi:hypothetical protein
MDHEAAADERDVLSARLDVFFGSTAGSGTAPHPDAGFSDLVRDSAATGVWDAPVPSPARSA